MRDLLTVQEIADVLGVSPAIVMSYIDQGKISAVEPDRFDLGAVLAVLGAEVFVKEDPASFWTYEDYLKLPEAPGCRFEILEGILVKEPSPSLHHQRISRELGRQLMAFFDQYDPAGEIFFAPLDVTLSDSNVLQPDMIFVSSARKGIMHKERIDGPCDLVVEIMSPASRRKDRLQKLEIYRKAGIPHYWLVDPEENTLEAFLLSNGDYALVATGGPGDNFTNSQFPGLVLDLERVFRWPELMKSE